jgi:hypothetical protein
VKGQPVPDDVAAAIPGGAWLMCPANECAVVVRAASGQETLAATAAAAADVGPRVVAAPEGWLAVEYVQGRHLGALELSRPAVVAELANLLRRLHQTDVTLAEASLGRARAMYLADLPPDSVPTALKLDASRADDWENQLEDASGRRVPAHLDVVANVLVTSHGMRLIDFEYAAAVDPARELGQVVWEAELDLRGLERLVDAYGADTGVAVEATAAWTWITGVTWTLWAMAREGDPVLERYARRSWERLQRHWSRPGA